MDRVSIAKRCWLPECHCYEGPKKVYAVVRVELVKYSHMIPASGYATSQIASGEPLFYQCCYVEDAAPACAG